MRHCSLRYRNDWFQVKNEDSNSLYSTQSNVFVSFSFLLFIYYFLARVNALISPKMPVPELQHEQVSLSSDTHAKKKKKKSETTWAKQGERQRFSIFKY